MALIEPVALTEPGAGMAPVGPRRQAATKATLPGIENLRWAEMPDLAVPGRPERYLRGRQEAARSPRHGRSLPGPGQPPQRGAGLPGCPAGRPAPSRNGRAPPPAHLRRSAGRRGAGAPAGRWDWRRGQLPALRGRWDRGPRGHCTVRRRLEPPPSRVAGIRCGTPCGTPRTNRERPAGSLGTWPTPNARPGRTDREKAKPPGPLRRPGRKAIRLRTPRAARAVRPETGGRILLRRRQRPGGHPTPHRSRRRPQRDRRATTRTAVSRTGGSRTAGNRTAPCQRARSLASAGWPPRRSRVRCAWRCLARGR